jgi:hypothetical protein
LRANQTGRKLPVPWINLPIEKEQYCPFKIAKSADARSEQAAYDVATL